LLEKTEQMKQEILAAACGAADRVEVSGREFRVHPAHV
jgi:hypothetical protein